MLTKLIKYDLKSLSRVLIPANILLLIYSFLARCVITSELYNDLPYFVIGLGITTYIILLVLINYITLFAVLYLFYKNLFTDEGYLTLTLPVTPSQHLLAKTISGTFWVVLSYAVITISILMLVLVPDVIKHSDMIMSELTKSLEMPASFFFISTFMVGLISCFFALPFYYVCIALGQLFNKHRILAAVILFFALSSVVSVISLIILFVVGAFPLLFGPASNLSEMTNVSHLLSTSYGVSCIIMVIQGVLSYVVTLYIMKKKINLE